MKKWLSILLASLLVIVLAACNNSDKLTLEEVYKKAIDRQNEIKSMSSDVQMDMKMVFGQGDEKLELATKSDLKMDMTIDPLTMYIKGKMSADGIFDEESFDMDLEAYITKDSMYMFETESDVWMKFAITNMEEILGQTANQANSAEQLKALEPFIEDFKIEEKDNEYILTLKSASEKFTKYILEQIQLSDSLGLSDEEKEIIEKIKYDEVSYVLKIKKDTFDITEMNMILSMTLGHEGESMGIETNSKMLFSNFDKVEEIKVPQQVIDSAVEVDY